MTDSSRWDALADALSFSTGNPGLDEMLRASLRAGAASDANLSRHVRDFELRNDAALDIHLHGEAEDRHVSRGDLLGRFLRDVTEAVKQLAKDSGGLSRHSVNLWVHAPAPGSMRLQLRTLEPKRLTEPLGVAPLPDTFERTLDAKAVLTLVALMNQSHAEEIDSPLTASLQRFRAPARNSVAKFARLVDDAEWTLRGHADVRGRDPIPVEFGGLDAKRLYAVAKIETSSTEGQTFTGHIDTWSWSRSTMVFEPDGGRPFEASVSADEADAVGRLHGDRNNRVTGDFLVTTAYPEGSPFAKGRSYGLVRVRPHEPETQDPMV